MVSDSKPAIGVEPRNKLYLKYPRKDSAGKQDWRLTVVYNMTLFSLLLVSPCLLMIRLFFFFLSKTFGFESVNSQFLHSYR